MPASLSFAWRYFALVFGTGFVLGTVRVLWLVPHLGERWAELLEMPLMGLAIWCWARWLLRRQALGRLHALAAGGLALALLVGAELTLAVLLQERSLQDYIGSRDPVSGTVYLLMLIFYALLPAALCHHARPEQQGASDV